MFIQPAKSTAANISANLNLIGDTARTNATVNAVAAPISNSSSVAEVAVNTPVKIAAATSSWFRIVTPAGVTGYIPSKQVTQLTAIRKITTKEPMPLLDQPLPNAAKKLILTKGQTVEVVGRYQNFSLVQHNNLFGWMQNIE